MALGSTQPLTEMSTRNLPGGKKQPAYKAETSPPSVIRMSEFVGASTSRNPKGLHGLYRENFTLPFHRLTLAQFHETLEIKYNLLLQIIIPLILLLLQEEKFGDSA
jgi:hypothetical protein